MAIVLTTSTSDLPGEVNNVYVRGLLSAARKVLPFFNGTRPGTLDKKKGSATVLWRRIENLAAVTTALTQASPGSTVAFGIGRTTVRPTYTNISKAVAKYANGITLAEEIDLFNIDSDTMALMDVLGANAGESLNSVARLEFDNASQVRYASGAANKSAVVAEMLTNDVKWAVNKLQRNSAMKLFPMGTGSTNVNTSTVRASYFGINHPDVEIDIRAITGYVGVEQYGGYTETLVGEHGAVGGVRWVTTEIAPIETGAGTTSTSNVFRGTSVDTNDVYTSYVYGKDAIGTVGLGAAFGTSVKTMDENRDKPIEIIYHKPGSSGIADAFNEIGQVSWKAWHATKILNGNWIVKIQSLCKNIS